MALLADGLARVALAGAGVVHAFALAVQAAIPLRAALFRRAALRGDFGRTFLFGRFAGVGLVAFRLFSVCCAGIGQQARGKADGQQGTESVVGAGGRCVKGRHRVLDEMG